MPRRHLPLPAGVVAPADSTPLPRLSPARGAALVANDPSTGAGGYSAKTWAVGDYVGGHVFAGADSTGTAADTPLGVVKYNPTGFGHAVVATRGVLVAKAAGTIAAGKPVRMAAGNALTAAADSADLASPIVGVAVAAGDATAGVRVALRPAAGS